MGNEVTGSLEAWRAHTSEQQAKLLQDCSKLLQDCLCADRAGYALNHTKAYIQKAETWKDEKIGHSSTQFQLVEALRTVFPFDRYETAKEFLDRVTLAQQLSVGLNPTETSTFASAIATAVSPELEALKALRRESLLHREAVLQADELRKRRLRGYDAMKQKQHEELVEFFEDYRKEEVDIVWDALSQKTKMLAAVNMCPKENKPESILKRVIQNAGSACKKVEVKLLEVEGER